MAELDRSIAAVLNAYAAAVHAKDVDAFMRLYDPNARIFDCWGVWSYEDAATWRTAVEGWLSSLGTERVNVVFNELKATVGKDHATVSAIVSYAGVSAQGEPLRSMHNRLSWMLKMSGHAMRIVHEHTSAPVGFDDMKAILQRQS